MDEGTVGSQHRTSLIDRTKHKKVPSGFDIKGVVDSVFAYMWTFRFGKV